MDSAPIIHATRPLGRSGLTTPPLILGGNVFGWTVDRQSSASILDAFVAGGGRMIDTADVYSRWAPGNSGGESESMIGAWLAARRRREDIVIATKVGAEMNGSKGLTAQRIAASADASLKRLQTDYIDLYFAHIDDADTPLDETLTAFDALVQAGKVRAIGASNYSAARLAEALRISEERHLASYTVVQPQFNLLERGQFEGPLQDLCVARDLSAVPYYGLASGFLTGKYRTETDTDGRARSGAVKRYLTPRGFRVLDAVEAVAAAAGASPAQVALAWIAAQPGVAAPIASATSVAQVNDLAAGMRVILTPQQLAALDAASAADDANTAA